MRVSQSSNILEQRAIQELMDEDDFVTHYRNSYKNFFDQNFDQLLQEKKQKPAAKSFKKPKTFIFKAHPIKRNDDKKTNLKIIEPVIDKGIEVVLP